MPLLTPPPPPPPGDVAAVAIVRRLDQEPRAFDRIWEPYLAEIDGDLLVAFGDKLIDKPDMGSLVCCRSIDHGATWSEPVTIFDSAVAIGGQRVAYANAVLFHPPGQGIIWCFGMRCPLYYPDSEDSQLCAAYSVDHGHSWQPVELAVDFHSALIIVAGITTVTRNGGTRYLLPAHRNTTRRDPHGDTQQFVLESENLLEWHLAGYVPQAQPPKVFLHEGSIAPGDGPGELKLVMRTSLLGTRLALDPPTAYSSVSRDGGHTWSSAQAEPPLYNTISKAFYGRDSTGRHLYVYSDGPAWERRALKYKVQSVSGQWSAARVFYDGGVHNSYPTLMEEGPGRFLCVWDSATDPDNKRTAIRFGRLTLP
jgi:hypothetical protein